MPIFYFHLIDEIGRTEDREGVLLPDASAATETALRHARAMMAHDIRECGIVRMDRVIEIVAQDGGTLAVVPFTQAVSLKS